MQRKHTGYAARTDGAPSLIDEKITLHDAFGKVNRVYLDSWLVIKIRNEFS